MSLEELQDPYRRALRELSVGVSVFWFLFHVLDLPRVCRERAEKGVGEGWQPWRSLDGTPSPSESRRERLGVSLALAVKAFALPPVGSEPC